MADADDATFEFEEELGLPQGGPVLEDGMDMYDGQQGEGQQEGPGMHDPQHRDTPMLDLQPEVCALVFTGGMGGWLTQTSYVFEQ
eukprot:scaffold305614_cov21-Tisochrysis_lutea.AAC.3